MLKIKTDSPLTPAEESYMSRRVSIDLFGKYFTLSVIALFLGFLCFLLFRRILPSLAYSSAWAEKSIFAALANTYMFIFFVLTGLLLGAFLLFWRPYGAGYSVRYMQVTVRDKGKNTDYGPLIVPPLWRKYLRSEMSLNLKVANLNSGINLGQKGFILLSAEELHLNMDEHAPLGLLQYRNIIVTISFIVISLYGILGTVIFADLSMNGWEFFRYLLKNPFPEPSYALLTFLIVLIPILVLVLLFRIIRNILIRSRVRNYMRSHS